MPKIRKFYVRDEKVVWGEMHYQQDSKEFALHIYRDTNIKKAPIMLYAYAEVGMYDLSPEWSLRWVRDRIIPPSRANIGEIMRGFGMTCYDEFEMFVKLNGRCVQDELYIEEMKDQ